MQRVDKKRNATLNKKLNKTVKNSNREGDHLFKPGQSGNPKGRPKGKSPTVLFRKSIADEMPEIIKTLVLQAKKGDVAAARVLLDRVCPPIKAQALPISLQVFGSLAEQGNEIIRATMAGHIPPDIGSQLIAALAAQSKLIEMEDLIKRIEKLEAGGPPDTRKCSIE